MRAADRGGHAGSRRAAPTGAVRIRRARRSPAARPRRGPGRPAGPGGDAERRILDAALTAFATRGYAETGIRDIVTAAGVAQPTLYHHFHTKAELFGRILETSCEPALGAWESRVRQGRAEDWRGLLLRFACESFELARADARIPRLLFQSTFGPPVPEVQAGLEAVAGRRFAIVRRIMALALEADAISPAGAAGGADGLALAFCCLVDQHVNVLCRDVSTVRLLTAELAGWLVGLFVSGASAAR
jgi:AcrR family transcriptional regulator